MDQLWYLNMSKEFSEQKSQAEMNSTLSEWTKNKTIREQENNRKYEGALYGSNYGSLAYKRKTYSHGFKQPETDEDFMNTDISDSDLLGSDSEHEQKKSKPQRRSLLLTANKRNIPRFYQMKTERQDIFDIEKQFDFFTPGRKNDIPEEGKEGEDKDQTPEKQNMIKIEDVLEKCDVLSTSTLYTSKIDRIRSLQGKFLGKMQKGAVEQPAEGYLQRVKKQEDEIDNPFTSGSQDQMSMSCYGKHSFFSTDTPKDILESSLITQTNDSIRKRDQSSIHVIKDKLATKEVDCSAITLQKGFLLPSTKDIIPKTKYPDPSHGLMANPF